MRVDGIGIFISAVEVDVEVVQAVTIIFWWCGIKVVGRCTVMDNYAVGNHNLAVGADTVVVPAGLAVGGGSVTLVNNTLSGNSANNDGGCPHLRNR